MAKKPSPPPEPDAGGEEQTSTRLYKSDSRKLKELAAMNDESIPDAFRRLFGHLLDASLIETAERRPASGEHPCSVPAPETKNPGQRCPGSAWHKPRRNRALSGAGRCLVP